MLEHLVNYLVAAMIAWCPPAAHARTGATEGQTIQRYTAIATNIASVALDENEKPLFQGEDGRAKTALLIAAIASYESGGYRKDIDNDRGTGDHGQAHCLLQLHMPTHGGRDCIHKGLIYARSSFHNCGYLPPWARLAEYASGNCHHGTHDSYIKMTRMNEWWETNSFNGDKIAFLQP